MLFFKIRGGTDSASTTTIVHAEPLLWLGEGKMGLLTCSNGCLRARCKHFSAVKAATEPVRIVWFVDST
jgi:hypothetical protein